MTRIVLACGVAATLPVRADDPNTERANEPELKRVQGEEEADELVLPLDCKRTDRENSVVLRLRSILLVLKLFEERSRSLKC